MNPVNTETALWWIVLGIGVVVVVCVVILLSLLAAFVRDIEHHVGVAAVQLQHVLTNTSTYPHVHETARLVGALGAELQAHSKVLSGRTEPL